MNKLFLISFLFFCQLGWSQNSEKEDLQNLIEDFFEAFHAQDSKALRNFAHPEIKMQSVAIDAEGNTTLSTEEYTTFLKSIASIPETTKFEEQLHGFEININDMIANVSIPYSFFINNELSHCGVNTFQLMKSKGEWKIIYLVDTRSKLGCE
ncbi:nuclear transport factor 2 family protein [Salegentibacter salegens]|uniref:Putative lumazine-binding n=1 Tax=Salegentibacter salegens TaxID=143223 RepID=A0A1M7P1Q2_9FLAO|nr:nuclear transport factor 2 family protein [Salegentibacter salegens]PRX46354.1 putative lumazine-binding protein [Salegentibacter salegens]SHN09891.1 Putative lumazine-binding [Salegentibacter salegens]